MADILIGSIGFTLLYFLTGYPLSHILLKKKPFFIKNIFSIGFSLILNVYISLILGFFNILQWNTLFTTNLVVFFSTLILYFKLNSLPKINRKNLIKFFKTEKKKLQKFLKPKNHYEVVVVLLFSFFVFLVLAKVRLAYDGPYVHPNHPLGPKQLAQNKWFAFPIHADEWQHLAQITYALEHKSLVLTNPYDLEKHFRLNPQLGFHMFGASHFILTKWDTVLGYKYLAPLFGFITSLFLYVFSSRLFNKWVGFLSIIFFASIKSDRGMLGSWYFIPFTMSFFMLYFIGYLYLENKKITYLFLPALLSVYPSTFFMFFFGVLVDYFYKLKKSLKIGTLVFFIIIFLFIRYLPTSTHDSILPQIIKSINFTFDYGNSRFVGLYFIDFFGATHFFFLIIGIFIFFRQKFNPALFGMFLFLLINLISYKLTDLSFFIHFIRAYYLFAILSTIISSLGIYYFSLLISSKLSRSLSIFFSLTVFLLVFYSCYVNYYDISQRASKFSGFRPPSIAYFVDENGYDALKYLGDNYPPHQIILTPPSLAYGTYSVAQNQCVSVPNANIGHNKRLYKKILDKNCRALSIVKRLKIKFFILNRETHCAWLHPLYSNDAYHVYEVVSN
jgi:hypothetical protein